MGSKNVRYASACRQRALHSTCQKSRNRCPICFSLSSSFPTLNSNENLTSARESLVLTELSVGNDDDKLKHIGQSLSHSYLVGSRATRRRSEAYRTVVEHFRTIIL